MKKIFNTLGLKGKKGYNIHNNTYKRNKSSNGRQSYYEIGDDKQPRKFYPQLKISTLDNESNLSLRFLGAEGDFTSEEVGDKLRLHYDNHILDFYDIDDDRFEFGVNLKSKPASNKIQFSMKYKNLSFYRQGTSEEESEKTGLDVTVPDDVVGSYAIYHNRKEFEGRKKSNYRTGKLFHIYAPWAEDANGQRVWCDLDIDTETDILTITMPRSFYENAAYPVFIDPTVGNSVAGASELTAPSSHYHIDANAARHYTSGTDKEAQIFYARIRHTLAPCSLDLAVYDMGVGINDPDGATKVGSDVTLTSTQQGALAWEQSTDQGIFLTDGNNYTIAIGNLSQPSGVLKIGYDGGTGQEYNRQIGTTTLPATFVEDASFASYIMDFYVDIGDQPGPPIFSGTIPNYSGARTTPVSIATISYFSNPETFTANNLPSGAVIDTNTGVISWASPVNGVYSNVTVTCTNTLGNDTSNAFSITINAQLPTFDTTITDKNGNVNNAITPVDTSLNFSFGETYSASGLPAGLSIDVNTGIVSGTPTTQQTYASAQITATNSDGSVNSNTFTWDIGAELPIPTITDINSGNNLVRNASVVITGTHFETPQGTGYVTFNDIALAVTSWSDTSITVTIPSEGFVFGAVSDLVIKNNSDYTVSTQESFVPESGYTFVTLSLNYLQFPTNSFIYGENSASGLVVGDQIVYEAAAAPSGDVSIGADAVAAINNVVSSGNYTFSYYFNDVSDLTTSSNGTALVTLQSSGDDIFPPNWVSSPSISSVAQTTATAAATINETGNIYGVVVPQSEATPTASQIKLGQASSGSPAVAAFSSLNATSLSESITGLSPVTDYKACFTAEDLIDPPNLRNTPTVINFTTTATVDTTPPQFATGPTVSQVTQTTCIIDATINETGTIYWGVIPQYYPTPAPSDVVNGTTFDPDTGDENTPIPMLAFGSASSLSGVVVSALQSGTALKACFVARDAANNIQVAVTEINFTTSQAGTARSITDVLKDRDTGVVIANTLLDYQVQTTWGVVTDTGQVTTDANGGFTVNNLLAAAGAARIILKDAATGDNVAQSAVTITEA